jgi:hypothetical protein
MLGIIPQLCHDRPHPNPFKFIIQESSYHSTLSSTESEGAVKQPTNNIRVRDVYDASVLLGRVSQFFRNNFQIEIVKVMQKQKKKYEEYTNTQHT